MIRISTVQPNGTTQIKVEGRAVGPFGEELVKFLRQALSTQHQVSLDLESLVSIDQPTLEYLAQARECCVITRAPRYMNRWMEGLRMTETLRVPGAKVQER